jgi:hypothetical protein
LHDTCLDVHGEILQVHGAGQCQGDSGKKGELNDAESTLREGWASILVTSRKSVVQDWEGGRELGLTEYVHVHSQVPDMEMEAQRGR